MALRLCPNEPDFQVNGDVYFLDVNICLVNATRQEKRLKKRWYFSILFVYIDFCFSRHMT